MAPTGKPAVKPRIIGAAQHSRTPNSFLNSLLNGLPNTAALPLVTITDDMTRNGNIDGITECKHRRTAFSAALWTVA